MDPLFKDRFTLLKEKSADDLKSHKQYQQFNPLKDPGYLVVFEHINEAAELLFKK